MGGGWRLRDFATIWVVAALVIGLIAATVWFRSARAWDAHLDAAHEAGYAVYRALRTGGDAGESIAISALPPQLAAVAEVGNFGRLPDAPQPNYVTLLSLKGVDGGVQIGVVSDRLRYPVADIDADTALSAPAQLADLTRLFATYCSDPILYARLGTQAWHRIDGTQVWGCEAAPRDMRLIAVAFCILAVAVLLTIIANATSAFDRFAQALTARRRLGGPESYDTTGPTELREIVGAVNTYLQDERDQLANRAVVLSGVSHDLGTPATRLRLRAALIADPDLREKLEADIDRMTGIIDSVLTYTRAEMNSEQPRKMSLGSLVETIVTDYQDLDKPVAIQKSEDVIVPGAQSVFMSRRGQGVFAKSREVMITGRPIALERAISNLIDNALKYGGAARVRLETDAESVAVVVENARGTATAADIADLMAPFKRGEATGSVDGYGLGLTIVETIASQHGGTLTFEDTRRGLAARFCFPRI